MLLARLAQRETAGKEIPYVGNSEALEASASVLQTSPVALPLGPLMVFLPTGE